MKTLLQTLLVLVICLQCQSDACAQPQSRRLAYSYYEHDGTMHVPLDSTTYGYNSNASQDYQDTMTRYATATGVMPQLRWLYTYNADKKVTTQLIQEWVTTTGSWRNANLENHSYNSAGYLTLLTTKKWDTVANTWINDLQIAYTYDGSNNRIATLTQGYTGGVWVNLSNNTLVYNSANKNTVNTGQTWTGTSWLNAYQYQYTYTTAGYTAENIYQQWNTTSGAWENVNEYYTTYTPGNLTDSTYTKGWNSGSASWDIWSVEKSGYDVAGNNTSRLLYAWNSGTAQFDALRMTSMTYNGANKITYSDVMSWDTTVGWTYKSGNSRYYYYYEEYGVSVPRLARPQISTYPDPATSVLNIELAEEGLFNVAIYDMQGRLANANSFKTNGGKITILVAEIPPGNYLLTITGNGIKTATQIKIAH